MLQRKGDVPTNAWLLAMGTIDIREDYEGYSSESQLSIDCMMDSDVATVLESEVCTQMPSNKNYM